jgi:hypothetical protein
MGPKIFIPRLIVEMVAGVCVTHRQKPRVVAREVPNTECHLGGTPVPGAFEEVV